MKFSLESLITINVKPTGLSDGQRERPDCIKDYNKIFDPLSYRIADAMINYFR